MADTKRNTLNKYKRKLNKLFTNAPAEKKDTAALLVDRAAFLLSVQDDLQEEIALYGATETYDHGGGQSGTTISAALKAYNQCNQQLLATVRQLKDFLPEDDGDAADELADFISAHKSK